MSVGDLTGSLAWPTQCFDTSLWRRVLWSECPLPPTLDGPRKKCSASLGTNSFGWMEPTGGLDEDWDTGGSWVSYALTTISPVRLDLSFRVWRGRSWDVNGGIELAFFLKWVTSKPHHTPHRIPQNWVPVSPASAPSSHSCVRPEREVRCSGVRCPHPKSGADHDFCWWNRETVWHFYVTPVTRDW